MNSTLVVTDCRGSEINDRLITEVDPMTESP